MEWFSATLAAAVTILTAAFSWLKLRDTARFKGIEESLKEAQQQLTESRQRILTLEEQVRQTERAYRADAAAWDKEKLSLIHELNALRATVARMEVGITAAIIKVDTHGEILECNPVASELFGWSQEELVGRDVTVLIPFRFRRNHTDYMRAVVEGKLTLRKDSILTFALSRTGQEIPVAITLSSWEEDGKQYYGAELRRRT